MSEENIKIKALITLPLVSWTMHWGCAIEALSPFGIPIHKEFGAYWHQCMSNMLEKCSDDNLDWVLTMDYDSMFTADDVSRLMHRFGQNPHIDALAALEPKRGMDEIPLMWTGETVTEVTGEPIKATAAHFGLTLIRVDALKKMGMPWLLSVPNWRGSYLPGKGKIDADIYFWHHWKRHGNTLYVDPDVRIGHLQMMVSSYDEGMRLRHTHWEEWVQNKGKP